MILHTSDLNCSHLIHSIKFDVNIITNQYTINGVLMMVNNLPKQIQDMLVTYLEIQTDHKTLLSIFDDINK